MSFDPMFYVEQMKNWMLLTLFIVFGAFSCEQRDPEPERNDMVYKDLQKELDLINKTLQEAEAEYETRAADLKTVVPQTGQIKSYEKKLFESQNKLDRLRQQKQYFEITLEQRSLYVRSRYAESFKKDGREWPDKKEIEDFQNAQKLQREKIKWDKNKGVVKDVPRGTKSKEEQKLEQ
ncbi:MAG: hypothetical protein A2622_05145 [Bdellovibrionales bacterium RIFCSPHIGHO2_01_FULL_40_29]|nr:MAG: hypothetical protein A2622_05145 [Bdellovibrionales bacterium RIFCSPHIGHO2_01_FULL_40_29]OFZ34686.1 MAG: hypothetical protein A3D17_10225 [Bdellovibrionales bacterium RIFCSPHIGHO2_02_FULL_40_15]